MTIWGDTWYITYLKTIGFALLGLALMVILTRIWDKYQYKKAQLLREQRKGHNK